MCVFNWTKENVGIYYKRILSESYQWAKSFLVFRLEEMEEKYLMRESKPEDIQMITELKAMLTERDQVIKKLIVRYFVSV